MVIEADPQSSNEPSMIPARCLRGMYVEFGHSRLDSIGTLLFAVDVFVVARVKSIRPRPPLERLYAAP
jgi:hypothetical protein